MQFNLVPYAEGHSVGRIEGSFELSAQEIDCRWTLTGDLDRIRIPARIAAPGRAMSLWEHTCFEFFIGSTDDPGYYEFNLSPSGEWNSFGFTGLRTGMAETDALVCSSSAAERTTPDTLQVTMRAAFSPPNGIAQWCVGVSAVIELNDGQRLYYALSHDGGRPDFHRRSNHRILI